MQNKPPLTTADGKTPLSSPKGQAAKTDIFSTLAKWLVLVMSIIPRFLASIMEHFTEAGSVGAIALGSLVFVAGVLFTTDSYWQSLFQGAALFPFFEESWAGWLWLPGFTLFPQQSAWAGIIFNPAFVFALSFFCNPNHPKCDCEKCCIWGKSRCGDITKDCRVDCYSVLDFRSNPNI